jgi:hypothetical protein
MRLREREGDTGRDDGMISRQVVYEGAVAGEAREGAAGGFTGDEGFAQYLVGQKAIVGHEGKQGRRKRSGEGNDQTPEDGHRELSIEGYNELAGPMECER